MSAAGRRVPWDNLRGAVESAALATSETEVKLQQVRGGDVGQRGGGGAWTRRSLFLSGPQIIQNSVSVF